MRFKSCFIIAMGCGFALMAAVSFGKESRVKQSPAAYFPETHYQFTSVLEGTEIRHEFVIRNRGDAPLRIVNVRTT